MYIKDCVYTRTHTYTSLYIYLIIAIYRPFFAWINGDTQRPRDPSDVSSSGWGFGSTIGMQAYVANGMQLCYMHMWLHMCDICTIYICIYTYNTCVYDDCMGAAYAYMYTYHIYKYIISYHIIS